MSAIVISFHAWTSSASLDGVVVVAGGVEGAGGEGGSADGAAAGIIPPECDLAEWFRLLLVGAAENFVRGCER